MGGRGKDIELNYLLQLTTSEMSKDCEGWSGGGGGGEDWRSAMKPFSDFPEKRAVHLPESK